MMKKWLAVSICIILCVLCVEIMACTDEKQAEVSSSADAGSYGIAAQGESMPAPPASSALPSPTLTPTPEPILKSGVESEEVKKLQQRLGELGYLDIEEYTTKYGPATERAVRLFQRQNGLQEDGIVGKETLACIYSADAKVCVLPLAGIRIGLDPGHQRNGNSQQEAAAPGSSETKNKVTSGTAGLNTGTPEYEVNLDVALILRERLEESGAEVLMTHETADVDISNQERAKMMNDAGVDLVLRLHCDGIDDTSVRGAMMLVPTGPYTEAIEEQSRLAGETIFKAYLSATEARDRGVIARDDQTGFNWSTVPVCNIEMGCLSNGEEEALLISKDYQEKCVQGLLQGIIDYFG